MHGFLRLLVLILVEIFHSSGDLSIYFDVGISHSDSASRPNISSNPTFTRTLLHDFVSLRSDQSEWGGLASLILSDDGSQLMGVSDGGTILLGEMRMNASTVNCTSLSLVDDETGASIFVESVTTVSGLPLRDTGKDGVYVRLMSSVPIRLFPQIDPAQYQGLVFNQPFEDPMALCPAALKEEVTTCPPSRGLQSIGSIEAEPGQSTGSILFVCEKPSETDGLIHGWACNPSTGDSWQFLIEAAAGWNVADIAYCASCNPHQVFFLSYNATAFAIETVLASTLVHGGTIVTPTSRIRLLEAAFTHPVQMHSLSVIPDPSGSEKVKLFVASRNETGETLLLTFSVELLDALADVLENEDSDSFSISLIVLIVLLSLGIILPIVVNRNPTLRARLEEIYTGKPKYSVRLHPAEAALSPPRAVLIDNPATFGKRGKRESGQMTPLEVVIE